MILEIFVTWHDSAPVDGARTVFLVGGARSKELLVPSPKPMLSEIHCALHG